MDYLTLLYRHMALECIQVKNGDLAPILCDNPESIHRLYVARHQEHYHVYFRHDVPPDLRTALSRLTPQQLFTNHDTVDRIFAQHDAPVTDLFCGKSYVYPELKEMQTFPNMSYFDDQDRCGIVIDGVIASQCMSIRANDDAAEAYVETHENFRRRGLGKIVVQAWIQRVLAQGKLPYYSHKVHNIASQHLAESVGCIWYMDDVGY